MNASFRVERDLTNRRIDSIRQFTGPAGMQMETGLSDGDSHSLHQTTPWKRVFGDMIQWFPGQARLDTSHSECMSAIHGIPRLLTRSSYSCFMWFTIKELEDREVHRKTLELSRKEVDLAQPQLVKAPSQIACMVPGLASDRTSFSSFDHLPEPFIGSY